MKLTKERIDEIIKDNPTTSDAILELYNEIPGFKECTGTTGHPIVSETTWKYISEELFIKYGSNASFIWMNIGFSGSKTLEDWTVDLSNFIMI